MTIVMIAITTVLVIGIWTCLWMLSELLSKVEDIESKQKTATREMEHKQDSLLIDMDYTKKANIYYNRDLVNKLNTIHARLIGIERQISNDRHRKTSNGKRYKSMIQ